MDELEVLGVQSPKGAFVCLGNKRGMLVHCSFAGLGSPHPLGTPLPFPLLDELRGEREPKISFFHFSKDVMNTKGIWHFQQT